MSPRMKYRPFDECKQLKNTYMYVCVSYARIYHSQRERMGPRQMGKEESIVRAEMKICQYDNSNVLKIDHLYL